MNIGLYDIDLNHSPYARPNLELMKIYNFHYARGDKVILMKPYDSPLRFSQVFYFKESTIDIPRKLKLNPLDKNLYGQGFFGKFTPLPPPYIDSPPDPIIYLSRFEKYKGIKWEKFSSGSIIRFENKDFSGMKKSKNMFIVDKDFCHLEGAEDFWLENENYNITFFYPLTLNTIEDYNRFDRFSQITSRDFIVNFKVTSDLLKEMDKFKYCLKLDIYDELTLMKIFLFLKFYNIKVKPYFFIDPMSFQDILSNWYLSGSKESLYDYCKTYAPAFIKTIISMPDNLRLLAKTSPFSTSNSKLVF